MLDKYLSKYSNLFFVIRYPQSAPAHSQEAVIKTKFKYPQQTEHSQSFYHIWRDNSKLIASLPPKYAMKLFNQFKNIFTINRDADDVVELSFDEKHLIKFQSQLKLKKRKQLSKQTIDKLKSNLQSARRALTNA